jgi:MOB kinase activator 1
MNWVQSQLDDETIFPSKIGVHFVFHVGFTHPRTPPRDYDISHTPNLINCIIGVPFPKNFQQIVKNIFKRLFRVYAHMYHSHFDKIAALGEEAHLNTSFKHFILFVNEFQLIDKKELAPLEELIKILVESDKS